MSTNVSEHGRLAMAIGNGITRLHRERYGRGANTTRTVLQRNVVLVLLEDIFTPSERTLIDAGDWEMVKSTRQAFQMAMGPAFIEVVEGVLDRKVTAFMSQVHQDPDVASELFLLEQLAVDGSFAPTVVEV